VALQTKFDVYIAKIDPGFLLVGSLMHVSRAAVKLKLLFQWIFNGEQSNSAATECDETKQMSSIESSTPFLFEGSCVGAFRLAL
jgi:hypothetical protein